MEDFVGEKRGRGTGRSFRHQSRGQMVEQLARAKENSAGESLQKRPKKFKKK